MKKRNAKRIPAIILTVALLFTTVFSTTVLVSAASFSPRYEAPSYDNPYYYSSKNIFYSAGYGMPNCTAYAFGRAYEILGYEPSLSHSNAQDWYGYNMNGGYYNYGSTPKVGAIACWSYNGGGHVAVVESIDGDTVIYSNSAWSGTNFYLTYGSVSNPGSGGNSWWNFQGYIYILDSYSDSSNNNDSSARPLPTDDYTTGTYRVNVSSTLNMRSGAGTSYNTVASVPNDTELVVTDIDSDSSYVWGYTSYNGTSGWVALSYCDYVTSSYDEESEPEETEPAETVAETEQVEENTEDNNEVSSDSEETTVTEEATEASDTVEPTEAATEPTEVHDYVLYIANENSEETVAYPLSDLYQTAVVTLNAGNYLVSMSEDGNKISGTYELVLTAKSEVSITYKNQDYFLIVYNEIEEASEPNSADTVSTPDEAQNATPDEPSAPIVKDTKLSVSKSSTADTPSQTTGTAESTNGAIQTGQNVQVEAGMILGFSLASLALLWLKRKIFL